jgi:hypothetical protein
MSEVTIIDLQARAKASAEPKEPPMPTFTWTQLERQLRDLATCPHTEELVGQLLSGIRRQARWKPPELVLREVLCLAWTMLDEDVCPPT